MSQIEYQYERINLARGTIRVIRILQGEYDSPIRCEVFQSYLDRDVGVPYEALSYTWGDSSIPKVPIEITSNPDATTKVFKILPNLYDNLRHLRSSENDRILWIDAICIDQGLDATSLQKRTHQVEQMQLIYKNAAHVVVWLGHLPCGQASDYLDSCMVGSLVSFADELDRVAMSNTTSATGFTAWDIQFQLMTSGGSRQLIRPDMMKLSAP